MGPQFFETQMGHTFFQATVPKIARELERIVNALQATQKSEARYDYRAHPAMAVVELLTVKRFDQPDAYVALDVETDAIRDTLASGYRLVRTEGDHAILEKMATE